MSLLLVVPVAGQRPRLDVRAAVLTSSTLVEDLLATPALKTRLGSGLGSGPRAHAALGPELSAGVLLPLRPGISLSGLLGWQLTKLQAEDDSGTREVQDLSVLHGLLAVDYSLRGPLVVSAGFGMLGYRSEAEGLFASGADLAPLVRIGAGGSWPVAGQSLTVRAIADVHRFGTPLLRSAGGAGGGVLRYGLQVGIVPGGAR